MEQSKNSTEYEEFEKQIEPASGEEWDRLKNMIQIPEEELAEKGTEYIIKSLKRSLGIISSEREKTQAYEEEQEKWI